MKIGKQIKQQREKANISQIEMAKALGISERTLRNYEKGDFSPTIKILSELNRIYKFEFNINEK